MGKSDGQNRFNTKSLKMTSSNASGNHGNESNGRNSNSFKSGGNNHLAGTIAQGDNDATLSKISMGIDEEDDEDDKEAGTTGPRKNFDPRGTKSKFTDHLTEYQR